jgi:hypothetical protein
LRRRRQVVAIIYVLRLRNDSLEAACILGEQAAMIGQATAASFFRLGSDRRNKSSVSEPIQRL